MSYTTILNDVSSDYSGPYVYYKVEVQTSNRTSSTIDVDVRAYGRLNNSSHSTWLGTGNVLTGTITIAGVSREVIIHSTSDVWYGDDSIGTGWRSPGTVSFTVTGISSSTTSLSTTFGVECTYNGSSDTSGKLNTRSCSSISISSYTPPVVVNAVTVQPIPELAAGYDGDIFQITCIPSGGTGYTYKWYKYADYYGDSVVIGTSQTLVRTMSHSGDDNNYVYCVVTDSTGGTATTNWCQLRIGTADSQTQVSTKQVEPVRIYNGNKFLYGIPFIYNSGWKYSSWNITYNGNNRANIAVAGNAIVG